jgi:hypothetical protein
MSSFFPPTFNRTDDKAHHALRKALKASDHAQVETTLIKLRRALTDADQMLLVGVQARRRAFVLENAIKEALELATAGAELCVILATIREALS